MKGFDSVGGFIFYSYMNMYLIPNLGQAILYKSSARQNLYLSDFCFFLFLLDLFVELCFFLERLLSSLDLFFFSICFCLRAFLFFWPSFRLSSSLLELSSSSDSLSLPSLEDSLGDDSTLTFFFEPFLAAKIESTFHTHTQTQNTYHGHLIDNLPTCRIKLQDQSWIFQSAY